MPDNGIFSGFSRNVSYLDIPIDIIRVIQTADAFPVVHIAVDAVSDVSAPNTVENDIAEHDDVGFPRGIHVIRSEHLPCGGLRDSLTPPGVRAVHPESDLIIAADVLEDDIACAVAVDVVFDGAGNQRFEIARVEKNR